MKCLLKCICLIISVIIYTEIAKADSVDVFVPQREVKMNSSEMAKNFDRAAKKVKESYTKDKNTKSGYTSPYSTKSKTYKNNQTKKYTSEWT